MDWAVCDESKTEMRTGYRCGVPGTFVPVCNRDCPHNEATALVLRSFGQVPAQVFARLAPRSAYYWKKLRGFARRYDDGAWTWLETANSYSGLLRRRYLEAARSLEVDGFSDRADWKIEAFLKKEKNRDPRKAGKPRLIYPRSARYNLELGSYLKPFEHWLWGRLTGRAFGLKCCTGRLVGKGLNPRQRANLIKRKFDGFPNCVCFEVDGKAFEAHVGPAALRAEHRVYTSAHKRAKRLRFLLTKQLVLEGKTRHGIKFSREGARASGDFNTGMGNTLCFLVEVIAAMTYFAIPFDVLADGDNALIFVDEVNISRVLAGFATKVLEHSGHEVSLERPARIMERIRFGGSAPVFLGERRGWTMVRDWHRVLSGAFATHQWLREPKFGLEWMLGTAMCELSLARGVPILQSFFLRAIEGLPRLRRVREHPFRDSLYLGAWFASEADSMRVTMEARCSFELAFGVAVSTQLDLEVGGPLKFDLGCWHHAAATDFAEWLDTPGLHSTWMDAELVEDSLW